MTQKEQTHATAGDLETLISRAVQKLGGRNENVICRYLPVSAGGYLHHFTMRKMKYQVPQSLSEMIKKFIIDVEKPIAVKPKQRAPRGSRARKELMNLSRLDLQKILQLAVTADDKELVRKLKPKRELKALKKELISCIKRDIVDQDLWNSFVESTSQRQEG